VFRQRKCGRAVSLKIVALLAVIDVRYSGELPPMLIFVAVHTLRELHQVESVLAFWNMAFGALDGRMLLHQRIGRRRMFFHPERCRLESLDVVAGGALAFIRTLHELPVVFVFVAVEAVLKSQRLLEIAARVATQTIHRLVLSFQWIFRFGVIEALIYRCQRDSFPTGGVVARLAGLLRKAAVMRIGVAICAGVECQPHVARLVVRAGRMTLRACHLRM